MFDTPAASARKFGSRSIVMALFNAFFSLTAPAASKTDSIAVSAFAICFARTASSGAGAAGTSAVELTAAALLTGTGGIGSVWSISKALATTASTLARCTDAGAGDVDDADAVASDVRGDRSV